MRLALAAVCLCVGCGVSKQEAEVAIGKAPAPVIDCTWHVSAEMWGAGDRVGMGWTPESWAHDKACAVRVEEYLGLPQMADLYVWRDRKWAADFPSVTAIEHGVRFSCGLAKYGQVRGVDGQGNGAVAHVATTSIMDKGFDNISSCVTTSVPSSASILDVPLSRDALGMWTVVSSNPGSSIDGGEVSLTLPSESAVATLSPPQLAEPPSINRPFSALIAQSRGIYRGRQLGRALPHALARINDVGQLQVHLYDKPASCSDEDWPRMATAFTLPPGPGGTYFGGGRTLAPCVIDDAVVRASELVLAGSPRECQVSIAPFRAARAEHVHGTLELDQPSSFNGVTIAHGTIGSGTFDAEICKDERPNPVTYPSEAQPGPVRGMITGDTLTIKSALASVDTAGGLTKLTLYLRAGVTCNNRGESDLAWVGIDPRAGGASHFVGAPQPITGVTATDTSVDSSLGNAWMVVQRLDDARATGSLFVDIPSERTRFAGQFDASVCH